MLLGFRNFIKACLLCRLAERMIEEFYVVTHLPERNMALTSDMKKRVGIQQSGQMNSQLKWKSNKVLNLELKMHVRDILLLFTDVYKRVRVNICTLYTCLQSCKNVYSL